MRTLLLISALALCLGIGIVPLLPDADSGLFGHARAETPERVAAGNEIAFRRSGETGVGNCIACHAIAGGESPGNMGPPLVAIQARFPDREQLRLRIYDGTRFNPISAMPPFGKHGILTAEEIELVMDFLYTL